MAISARTIITDALQMLGILGATDPLSAEDASLGLRMLNYIVDAWNVEKLYIYATTTVNASFSGSTATIGPAMTFNTDRPVSLISCFYRIGTTDYPVEIIDVNQYNSIMQKSSTGSYPLVMYYDNGSPNGNVYVWPVPTSSTAYYITVNSQLDEFADLDTEYDLPQGYARALIPTLAEDIAPAFQTEARPSIINAGSKARRMIKRANVVVPILQVTIPGNTANGATYGKINIITGQ